LAPCAGNAWTILIAGRRQLLHVLRICVEHYNRHRPHRNLGLWRPSNQGAMTRQSRLTAGQLHRRDVLGGLIHEYERAA